MSVVDPASMVDHLSHYRQCGEKRSHQYSSLVDSRYEIASFRGTIEQSMQQSPQLIVQTDSGLLRWAVIVNLVQPDMVVLQVSHLKGERLGLAIVMMR